MTKQHVYNIGYMAFANNNTITLGHGSIARSSKIKSMEELRETKEEFQNAVIEVSHKEQPDDDLKIRKGSVAIISLTCMGKLEVEKDG